MKNHNDTIRKLVSYLNDPEQQGGFWLPNIQRPFVWREEQIERLFDSLMRDYPISTMLVWRTPASIKCRKFIDHYHPGKPLSQYQVPENDKPKMLVLDGQQRLQSLYIGLSGSYDGKELFFNVGSGNPVSPDDIRYEFRFLKPGKAIFPWVRFKDIVFYKGMPNHLGTELAERSPTPLPAESFNRIVENVWRAHNVFCAQERIAYQLLDSVDNPQAYTENDVVEIFIRANSGGTQLSKSDLLFSLLTSAWDEADARMEGLLEDLNAGGYRFDRDLVLKACLVLLGKGANYDVAKFRDETTRARIIENWGKITAAVCDVRDFLRNHTFVRSHHALTSYNGLLPLIYFRYHYPEKWAGAKGLASFVLRVMVTQAFSGRPDNLINKLTRQIDTDEDFDVPRLFELIRQDGRSLDLTDDVLLGIQYGSRQIHLLFNLWYRQYDYEPAYAGNAPQVDHIFPQSALRQVKDYNPETGRHSLMRYPAAVRDQLSNCMLLTAAENGPGGKGDKLPAEWFADKSDAYLEMHLIPRQKELWALERFDDFLKARQKLLLQRLKPVLHELPASEETPDAPSEPHNDEQGRVQQSESNGAATSQRGEPEKSEAPGDGLRQAESAEEVMAAFLQRIAEPTKYIAGFRTHGGLELALERNRSGIALWTEVVPDVEESGFVMAMRYDATTPRNSNLNSKNCPRLKLGREVLTWKLRDTDELVDFINWYQNCRGVEVGRS
ncbi:DUF262 domain-containing protein [Halomonas sp. KM-1]|uniref:GmrSD restriction endonuclease domain-containing protein n=1 Tax=Halomonas sp. KM-1 TaxID=590061 RepID=UPI0002896651|nr:DUF262 domain-containing protein [Halomonas sp. KM-1]